MEVQGSSEHDINIVKEKKKYKNEINYQKKMEKRKLHDLSFCQEVYRMYTSIYNGNVMNMKCVQWMLLLFIDMRIYPLYVPQKN